MNDTVIKVDNLSKLYRLGEIGTGTISHDLNRWWARLRGKEDPLAKIGEINNSTKRNSNYVWALKDVNFEVEKGEVLGIIGPNGAGKSTLLKILSRVTTPTSGTIKLKGRIASLLEVGTGFHPELTGRENVFLNGAVLGMTKTEIRSRFDNIVDFAGVEQYIDTPVKRYSSGMYMRLAFAVAAFLEPEILIVDEVLAVGDAEFQKKCIGRMKDVSANDGRTVLFVSHQMDAIIRLCKRVIFLKNGRVNQIGEARNVVAAYLNNEHKTPGKKQWDINNAPGNSQVRLIEVETINLNGEYKDSFSSNCSVGIRIKYEILTDGFQFTHGINLYNDEGTHILSSHDVEFARRKEKKKKGIYTTSVWLPENFLNEGKYKASVAIMSYNPYIVHFHELEAVAFTIFDELDNNSARGEYGGPFPGVVRPKLKWIS